MNNPFLPLVASAIEFIQEKVYEWAIDCFGSVEADDPDERRYRALEEQIEFQQASGLPIEKIIEMAVIIYSKEPGEPSQEAAGTMISLLAWCARNQVSLGQATIKEYRRIMANKEKIKGKQRAKAISFRTGGVVDWNSVKIDHDLVRRLKQVLENIPSHDEY